MKKDNYIGKKYGKLTVISRVDDYISPSGTKVARYLCKCDCGNDYITRGGWLSCGKSICCSECSKKEKANKMTRDLSGQKFGRWTVIDKAITKKQGVFWNCVCDCGNKGVVRGTSLTSGNSTSCGCFAKEQASLKQTNDLSGRKFGRLLVIRKVERDFKKSNIRSRVRWYCKCDCGNEVVVNANDLISGNTLSCGCYKRDITSETHFEDLSGQRFGMLTIVKRVQDYVSPDSGRPRPQFLCKCDCGNEKIITKDSLMNGTISCGCVNSRGEREISEFLQEHCIDYKIQYSFNDLLGEGNVPLKFDFAIIDSSGNVKALIEFQGEQHYEPIKFFGGEAKYQRQKRYDDLKREYCKKHNIALIEISYKDSIGEKLSVLLRKGA